MIEATDDHPFYVEGIGWKTTIELVAGDYIETDGNGAMSVISVVDQKRFDKTYNFEVEGYHTYYVTKRKVLVHNCNNLIDSIFNTKAPKQTTPGTKTLDGQYINDRGDVQPWTAHYNEYGQQVGRTDYNAGNRAQGIPDTHHHIHMNTDQGKMEWKQVATCQENISLDCI